MLFLIGVSIFAGSQTAGATGDSLTGGGGTIEVEGLGAPLTLAPSIAFTTADASVEGMYIEISVTNPTTDDQLSIPELSYPDFGDGAISRVGDIVYVGTTTVSGYSVPRRMGLVDPIFNGENGANLRINIDSWPDPLANGTFEGHGNLTSPWSWTVINSQIEFGATPIQVGAVTTQLPAPGEGGIYDSTGALTLKPGNSALVQDNTTWTTALDQAIDIEADLGTGGTDFDSTAVYSDTFTAHTGDVITFDQRMICENPPTDYTCPTVGEPTQARIWVALFNVTTGLWDQANWAEMDSTTDWQLLGAPVTADGDHVLAVVGGAFFSSPEGIDGAPVLQRFFTKLRTDNYELTPTLSAATLSDVMREVQYNNTSETLPATTVQFTVGAGGEPRASTIVNIDPAPGSEITPPPEPEPETSPPASPTPEEASVVEEEPVSPATPPSASPSPEASATPSITPAEETAPPTLAASSSEPAEPRSSPSPQTLPSPSELAALFAQDPGAAVAALAGAIFAPPSISLPSGAAVANPAIGASGDDSAPPVPFDPLGSPESIQALSGALVMAAAVAGGVAAAAGGGGGRNGGGAAEGAAEGGDDSGDDSGGEVAELGAEADALEIERSAWGDRRGFLSLAPIAFLDRFSNRAAVVVAPASPLAAKLIVDGAYLRAIFGSFSLLVTLASITLAAVGLGANGGDILTPPWIIFLVMAILGVMDAFAGIAGALVFIIGTLLAATAPVDAADIRLMVGVIFVLIAPGLVMTAFRALRKDVSRDFSGLWERLTDFAIAPTMAGLTVSTSVMVLPAMAGLTLPVANHVASFGVWVAVAALARVALEEFASTAFPARLNAINPSEVPDPHIVQVIVGLVMSYAMWVFLSGALVGLTWQVFVGSAFFLLPAIIGMFAERFPNSPLLWHILPEGLPGLVFTLVVAATTASVLAMVIGANPTFAQWNMVVLPLPLLALSILGMFGRHGKPDAQRFTQRHPWLFRVGGVIMLVVALRLMAII